MTKKLSNTIVNGLEKLLTEKTNDRSKLNYEITHIRETIELTKNAAEEELKKAV